MRIYVAGKWQDREDVRIWHNQLRARGHEITCDWTSHEYPGEGQEHLLTDYALADIKGVQDCDVLIALFEVEYAYRGAFVEIGAALALGKRILILGHAGDSCIFMNHPLVRIFDNAWDVMEVVNQCGAESNG